MSADAGKQVDPSRTLPIPRRADRIVVVGVVNVTPDSFSDGGRFAGVTEAVAHGRLLAAEGADIIDVGGESTRPGAAAVSAGQEADRILPVIRELSSAGLTVSVDTQHAWVAERALAAGAVIVNDVSGGLADPAMSAVVRDAGCPWVLMHWRGPADRMMDRADYADVVSEVCDHLRGRVEAAVAAGISTDRLILDPGLGFSKTAQHNWQLLAGLSALRSLGFPVLVGASRKAFLGALLAGSGGVTRPPVERDDATAALSMYAAIRGAWGVRVHNVRPSVDAALTAYRLAATRGPSWAEWIF